MCEDLIFKALTEPTRRLIVDEMTKYKEQTLYELMVRLVMKHNVALSRQAIAKHIAILEEAGIIRSQRRGRYRVLKFSNVPIKQVMERWVKEMKPMQSKLNPYISFKDNAREAMAFYKGVFGGELTMNTFKEFHAGDSDRIMHAMLEADNGITFMASDTPPGMEQELGASIRMSLSGDNEAELRGYWQKLSDGATITMPLDKAPWGATFGMLTDKFGINWMVNIEEPKS